MPPPPPPPPPPPSCLAYMTRESQTAITPCPQAVGQGSRSTGFDLSGGRGGALTKRVISPSLYRRLPECELGSCTGWQLRAKAIVRSTSSRGSRLTRVRSLPCLRAQTVRPYWPLLRVLRVRSIVLFFNGLSLLLLSTS